MIRPFHPVEAFFVEDRNMAARGVEGGALMLTSLTPDGRVLGVFGGVVWPASGALEVLFLRSGWIASAKKTFLRDAKAALRSVEGRFDRIQAVCEDAEPYRRFLSHLGFVFDGTRKEDGKLIWRLL